MSQTLGTARLPATSPDPEKPLPRSARSYERIVFGL